jgi:hypothetical protein
VKTVDDLLGVREAFPGDGVHGTGHVKGDFQHPVTSLTGKFLQDPGYLHGLHALDDSHEGPLAPVTVLVGHDRVQLSTGKGTLVYTQARTEVFGENQPLVSVGAGFPGRVIT